jgi:Cu2+-exporting ATPase
MLRCEHCLIDFPDAECRRDDSGRSFCCPGCLEVCRFINDEGLGAFYEKRDWDSPGQPRSIPEIIDEARFMDSASASGDHMEVDLYLDGIRCASCIWLLEKVLGRTSGVKSARVNYATHKARINWDPGAVSLMDLLRRIYSTGYVPKPYSQSEAQRMRAAETKDLLVRFGTAGFLSSQLMIYSLALYAGYFQGMDPGTRTLFEIISMVLTIPVIFYSGMPIIKSAVLSLSRLWFNMDSLIAIGSGSAFIYSVYGLFTGGRVFFDTSAMIITLILLGRYIESSAKGRAAETVSRLSELVPSEATLIKYSDAGDVVERISVDAASLKEGMLVEVRPGEKFPVDGIVERGETEADESLLTGESRPVYKSIGASVIGGSQNLLGAVAVRVSRTGGETVVSGIIRAVEEAQASRPRIQGIADRVVGFFVPLILVLAVMTATGYVISGHSFHKALMTGISVLVIACPCSLGLATSLAVLVYTVLASSRGALVKGGDAAESAAHVEHVVFDKTGTLTTGRHELVRMLVVDPSLDESFALEKAASVEVLSEHGLGRALLLAAEARMPGFRPEKAEGFKAMPGKGVSALVGGRKIVIGNMACMEDAGMKWDNDEGRRRYIDEAGMRGESMIYMGWEGEVRAVFALSDELRPSAADAVSSLKKAGCSVSLVSGDDVQATSSVGVRAGIEDITGGMLPAQKRDMVAGIQDRRNTMMVGDGINDAPALAEAHVGAAMGRGTDIAIESADIVLLRDDLMLVPFVIRLSRRTFGIIRQNIFWAFFYNVVALPLAVAGMLHPIIAASAMAASSLIVVVNSLRIRSVGEV